MISSKYVYTCVKIRVVPDLVFLAGCRISGFIIRQALPDMPDNLALSCRIPDIQPDIRPNPNKDVYQVMFAVQYACLAQYI